MTPSRILFVCSRRGARAMIAQSFAEALGGEAIRAQSASFEPGPIGDLPSRLMREIGQEVDTEPPPQVFERFRRGECFDHVVTMCSASIHVICPLFRAHVGALYRSWAVRHAWAVRDFASLTGTPDERWILAREMRDEIGRRVEGLLSAVARDRSSRGRAA